MQGSGCRAERSDRLRWSTLEGWWQNIALPCFISWMSQLLQLEPVGEETLRPLQPRAIWWRAAVIVALTFSLYSSILARLAMQWYQDPNFSHGFFVPAFSLFVVWRDRDRWLSLSRKPSYWGLLILALALGFLVLGVLGAELFLSRSSLLLLIAGMIVLFLGTNYLRAAMFPLLFLFLMIPIPAIVFNEITLPLQVLASKVAATLLPWLGVPVLREGNVINLPAMSLEIAEACSGIRSLLSLITLAIIYGYLINTERWMKVVLALSAIPIAIVANSVRIVITGLLVQYWNPTMAEGFFHAFSGWLVFLLAMGMLFVLQQTLAWTAAGMRRRLHGVQP